MHWVIIAIIVIAILVVIIQAAVTYWPITIGLIVVAIAIYIIKKNIEKNRDERQRREYSRRSELRKIEEHKNQQLQYSLNLVNLTSDALASFEDMPKHLMSAEELIDQAKVDFDEGAFAPFWDSIEGAARKLGEYSDSIHKIKISSKHYLNSTSKYIEATKTREEIETKYVNDFPDEPVTRDAPPEIPAFPINEESVASMTAGNAIHDRMKIIIRKAQCDFQFATIYEQRKTNQLLVAGFTNLAEVIDGMGRRIASSIDDLGVEIENMSSTLNESIQNISTTLNTQHEQSLAATEAVANKIGGFHEFFQKDSTERSEREKRTLRMLDNIQRGKRPKDELPDIFGNVTEPKAHDVRAE